MYTHNTWNIEAARRLYSIQHWGDGYFDINAAGNVAMCVPGNPAQQVDLHALAMRVHNEDGMRFPLLVRFVNVLHDRVQRLQGAFNQAIADCGQSSQYTAIYPIKVNQQRSVVQEILKGGGTQVGLEAGSKPELMAVLGSAPTGSTIICNGYKDREYLRLALIGRQMGHRIFIVVEKPSELAETLEEATKLGIEPLLGIRTRLYTLGKGKWQNTGGEKSKFGLSAAQALHMIEQLQAAGKLDCLQLLHFHMGSQIANIQDIQRGMREASRYFAELHRLGANIRVVDVGGGLGVDYDGSRSRNECSINYSLQEYANTIVRSVQDVCEEYELPFPDFISESGRGLSAHHAVLITNVIDTDPEQPEAQPTLSEPDDDDPMILHNLFRLYHNRKRLPPSEIYHDAAYWLDDAHGMYAHGSIDLNQRARAEEFHRAICRKLLSQPELFEALEPEIQTSLQEKLADKYFCNFSLFQSMPDAWAIEQIFPIMPLHRLQENPDRRVTMQDLTCDSDGTVSTYVESGRLASTLALHSLQKDQPYLLGIFMVGAYQEILGDLHNLFGDTDSINVELLPDGSYKLSEPERGDTIDELLRYVHFEPKDLLAQCRRKLAAAVDDSERQKMLLREIEAGLIGYTYLED
ncbi:biosynthetic arginine decarboxylase [Thiothrix subterranea]|uniref:biosynthetic arginine decarboxylase n=1 Tax=Thiothrix subterranea TaxID=2735563 RepID=UPI00192A7431|nr:biosynthetic arginine decarboxylase [Thiothrix subterranea]QQZ29737.1 biosynthetic arginine decarboxylase [Thiothrix subterranea]